jgi:septal ring factor EnvC (AmiA/AmiB activator)
VPPSALFGNRLLLLAIVAAAPAFAQAPVEDRRTRSDGYTEAQQRVEFARQTLERSERRVKDAEQGLRDAESALRAVQSRYEGSKSQMEKARGQLTQARAAAGESRKAYEAESAGFQALRTRRTNDARGTK